MERAVFEQFRQAYTQRRQETVERFAELGIKATRAEINAEAAFMALYKDTLVFLNENSPLSSGEPYHDLFARDLKITASEAYKSVFQAQDAVTPKLQSGDTYQREQLDSKGGGTGKMNTHRVVSTFPLEDDITSLVKKVVSSMEGRQSFLSGENWRDDPDFRFRSDPNMIYVCERIN